jgi:alkylhydroperoxidase/carboxymuconolactone decarboxylase family protein YurZ
MSVDSEFDELFKELAMGGHRVVAAVAEQHGDAPEQAAIDASTALLVRIAALVTLDAAPASYVIHLGLADAAGLPAKAIGATLMELVPLIGTARVISAAGKIKEAVGELAVT